MFAWFAGRLRQSDFWSTGRAFLTAGHRHTGVLSPRDLEDEWEASQPLDLRRSHARFPFLASL